mgnify:CR=1 FL=1
MKNRLYIVLKDLLLKNLYILSLNNITRQYTRYNRYILKPNLYVVASCSVYVKISRFSVSNSYGFKLSNTSKIFIVVTSTSFEYICLKYPEPTSLPSKLFKSFIILFIIFGILFFISNNNIKRLQIFATFFH